jgi:hypothetical protein
VKSLPIVYLQLQLLSVQPNCECLFAFHCCDPGALLWAVLVHKQTTARLTASS